MPKLVPELDVSDLASSLAFYVELSGWRILWSRPEERFAYLERDGAELMLQEADGPGRRFRTAALHRPYGRGVNFEIEVVDIDALYARLIDAGHVPVLALETAHYETGDHTTVQRQFVISDPDGYLLRFCSRTPSTRP